MADFFLLTVGFRDGKLGALGVNRVWVGERLDFFTSLDSPGLVSFLGIGKSGVQIVDILLREIPKSSFSLYVSFRPRFPLNQLRQLPERETRVRERKILQTHLEGNGEGDGHLSLHSFPREEVRVRWRN